MTARAIGEIIAPILARCEAMSGFQRMINDLPDAARRKQMIIAAFHGSLITSEEATLLMQVYQLETA